MSFTTAPRPLQEGIGTRSYPGLGPPPQEVLMDHDIMSIFKDTPDLYGGQSQKKRKSNPSIDQVIKRADKDVDFWKARNERFQEHQQLVELKEIEVDDNEEAITLNDPLAILQKVTGMLSKQQENIEYRARRPQAKDSAQAGENALRLIDIEREVVHTDGLRTPVKYEELQSLLLRGWICARVAFNPGAIVDWDGDPYNYFPWNIYLCDPAHVYPNNANSKFTRVTHRYTTTVGDILDAGEFPDADDVLGDMDEDDPIEVTGVYEVNARWDYHCVYISHGQAEKQWLKKPQPIGYMPWVVALGGGFFFRGTPWDNGGKEYTKYIGVGILHTIALNQKYLDRYASMMATLVGDNADPFTFIMSDDEDDEPPEGGMLRGGHKRLTKDSKVQQMTKEANLQYAMPLMQMLQERQDKGVLPQVLWGGKDANITSGFAASLFMSAAHDIIYPYVRAWELYKSKLYRKCLEIFADFAPIDMPLMVMQAPSAQSPSTTWTEFYPEDVNEQGTYVEITLDPMTIQDRINLGQLAVMLVKENIISRDTARGVEFLRVKDPKLENMKIISELAYLDPRVIEYLIPIMTAETGDQLMGAVFNMVRAQEQMGMPGMPGGSGPGGEPGMMPSQVSPPQAQGMNQQQAMNARGQPPNASAVGGVGPGGQPPPPPNTNQPVY